MLKIAIVEDTQNIREGITYLINSSKKMQVIKGFESAEDLIEYLANDPLPKHPDIILMDIKLPGIDGIQATKKIKLKYPRIEIMMLTIFEDKDKILQSIKAGATGYILKDASRRNLISEIIELSQGGSPMTPRIARKILDELSTTNTTNTTNKVETTDNYKLSVREKEILKLMVKGFNYMDIAQSLSISPNTVRKHIQNIYQKLQVNSKAKVVGKAIYEDLI